MYKVINNMESLNMWMSKLPETVTVLKENLPVKELLENTIKCYDEFYGEGRDIQKDLGGYTVVLYGDSEETNKEYNRIISHHHIKSDEYEYIEKFVIPEHHAEVMFRLFLCSSDYSIMIITVQNIRERKEKYGRNSKTDCNFRENSSI